MIPRNLPLNVILSASLLVSACGQSFDELEDDGTDLADRLVEMDATRVEDMPNQGTAHFEGIAGLDLGTGQNELGYSLSRLTLEADFADNTVSGRMDDWATDTGNPLDSGIDGSLSVFAGEIDENRMTALATGRLSHGGRDARVAVEMDGTFLGDGAQAVSGEMLGKVRYSDLLDNGTPGLDDRVYWEVPVEGAFGAERR